MIEYNLNLKKIYFVDVQAKNAAGASLVADLKVIGNMNNILSYL